MLDLNKSLPFILAMTGASGSVYGLRLLQYLLESKISVELVVSEGALQVLREEVDFDASGDLYSKLIRFLNLSSNVSLKIHNLKDYGASIASGSYRTCGMAVVPCSIGTLGALANGLTDNLIHRAAMVCLKERRPLLVLIREMPFGQIQIKNMLTLSEAGAIVSCASPGFYHRPQTISDQIDFVVGRVLDQFGFDHNLFMRWKEESAPFPIPSGKIP